MSNIILSHTHSSMAAYEPLISRYGRLPIHFQYSVEVQSSSVTPNGHLWDQVLIRVLNYHLPVASRDDSRQIESQQMSAQEQKKAALVQLLKSWREGDEQEQRETLEYLKKALDEDRLSDRKLFP
jgi:hypothetical protein